MRLRSVARLRCLDEQHVGAGLAVTHGARDGRLETLDRDRVGARDDQRLARAPRIERRLDLADHLCGRNECLVIEVTAALGKRLVLDLDRVGPGTLEQPHRAFDIECIAVAGVGIDDQAGGNAVADHADNVGDLAHADETDVGTAEPCIGNRCAGDVKRRKTGLLGDERGERIIDAGRDHDGLAYEAGAQGLRIGHGYSPR